MNDESYYKDVPGYREVDLIPCPACSGKAVFDYGSIHSTMPIGVSCSQCRLTTRALSGLYAVVAAWNLVPYHGHAVPEKPAKTPNPSLHRSDWLAILRHRHSLLVDCLERREWQEADRHADRSNEIIQFIESIDRAKCREPLK